MEKNILGTERITGMDVIEKYLKERKVLFLHTHTDKLFVIRSKDAKNISDIEELDFDEANIKGKTYYVKTSENKNIVTIYLREEYGSPSAY